uniref:Uncharacterized protein n=1 Tax=Ditylenchus dipsaci TaxID=166011 RepID=A0A915DA98_9BILA
MLGRKFGPQMLGRKCRSPLQLVFQAFWPLLFTVFGVFQIYCSEAVLIHEKSPSNTQVSQPPHPSSQNLCSRLLLPLAVRPTPTGTQDYYLQQQQHQPANNNELNLLLQYLEKRSASQLLDPTLEETRDIRSPLGTMRFAKEAVSSAKETH